MALLSLTVVISGCTTNTADISDMELLAEYNLTKANLTIGGGSAVADVYVTLPDDVKAVTIKYNNISAVQIGDFTDTGGDFLFYTYNVVPQNGADSNKYDNNIIDKKSVRMKLGDAPVTGTLTLNSNGAKSIGITSLTAQGNIQVYIAQ